ncbi:MAG: primosomal protein N' [Clostridiales bacterium]|nr:primosomal protein N' [Clostridiales bacterium]
MYAEVIVDIASEQVDRVFTYRVPDTFRTVVCPGSRVRVPFGFREKEGFVLRLKDTPDMDESRVKNILAPLEDYPALLPQLVALAQEIREKTHCPLCEALRLMLPAQMRGGRVKVKTETCLQLAFPPEQVEEAIARQGRASSRKMILTALSDGGVHTLEEIRALVRNCAEPLRYLTEREMVRTFEREVLRAPAQYASVAPTEEPPLTEAQQEVLGELTGALDKPGGSRLFLLHGVTGSGKTEVFIRLTREVLRRGRDVIILVPEIILTPQMINWFRSRFGEDMAVLHSRLTPGERFDEWRRIRLGRARIVIGARSAVFAPVSHLGAIIVDEEHEQTYISDHYPPYDAREIARSRVTREGGELLLSSATPSILSYAMARRGDYVLLEMPHRVLNRPLPHVDIVDMREELRLGNRSMFSRLLTEKLTDCVRSGQQAMLFVNRRGYAPFVSCRRCGEAIKCDRCDVSMTYHATDRQLHCHYCGARRPMPEKCPACGSAYIRPCGVGTQKVEEEVKKLFPDVGVIRMDVDTTAARNAHYELLSRFRARQSQILVGTQMIAKGLDFPNVTLVGAVLADLSLNLPDYRSPERTYQLLVQVAGRAGRGETPGEVVIQSYKPDHFAIAAAAAQDYRAFFNDEFDRRRKDLYPPFTLMARVLLEGTDEEKPLRMAEQMKETLLSELAGQPQLKKRLLFIRADWAPIQRIQNRYRAQILMKLLNHPDTDALLGRLRQLTAETEEKKGETGVGALLEVNPASLA